MRHGAFVPACSGEHLGSTPTAAMEGELMDLLVDVLVDDWAGIEVRFAVLGLSALLCCTQCAIMGVLIACPDVLEKPTQHLHGTGFMHAFA